MRHWLVRAILATTVATTATPDGQIGVVSDELLVGVVPDSLDTFGQLDVARVDRLETEDFVFVQDGIVLTKAQHLASLKASGRKPGDLKFDISVKSEHMWMVADSAVMTGVVTITAADGKPTRYAFADVMRRRGRDWRIQHSHYSTEREPASR